MTEINKLDIGYIKRDICMTNDINVIKFMLEEKMVDINAYGIGGHTPLHDHVTAGQFNIVKFLLSKGADINKKNIYGDNVIDDTLEFNQDDEIYKYLINISNVSTLILP